VNVLEARAVGLGKLRLQWIVRNWKGAGSTVMREESMPKNASHARHSVRQSGQVSLISANALCA
jgi:hypothetical protein